MKIPVYCLIDKTTDECKKADFSEFGLLTLKIRLNKETGHDYTIEKYFIDGIHEYAVYSSED